MTCPRSISKFGRDLANGVMTLAATVPCGSCTQCCRDPSMAADLQPHEVDQYEHVVMFESGWQLARKGNGECAYFLDGKCSIYNRRPVSCQSFDCRRFLLGMPPGSNDQLPFVEWVFERWDEWRLETPEDIDHMFAWHRAITETFHAAAGRPSTRQDFILNVMLLFRLYVPEASEVREQMGLREAKAFVLAQDKTLREVLQRHYRNMVKDQHPIPYLVEEVATGVYHAMRAT